MEDPDYKEKTYQEFQIGQQMGIGGFPSVVLSNRQTGIFNCSRLQTRIGNESCN